MPFVLKTLWYNQNAFIWKCTTAYKVRRVDLQKQLSMHTSISKKNQWQIWRYWYKKVAVYLFLLFKSAHHCWCSLWAAFHLTWAECGGICGGRCSLWLGETNLWETKPPVSRCSMRPLCEEFSDWKSDTEGSRRLMFPSFLYIYIYMYTPTYFVNWEIDLCPDVAGSLG